MKAAEDGELFSRVAHEALRQACRAMGGKQLPPFALQQAPPSPTGSHGLATANQPHRHPFDGDLLFAGINDDRCEIGVLGNEFDHRSMLAEALDGDILIQSGHDNLPVSGLGTAVNGQ